MRLDFITTATHLGGDPSSNTIASTGVLSQTLSSITSIKLDQLQKQKQAYEAKQRSLCEDVASELNRAKRVKKLLRGSAGLQSVGLRKNEAFSELESFFDQAEYDPSITELLLQQYDAEIHGHLRTQANKYEFASLYGKLVENWIASAGELDVYCVADFLRKSSEEQTSSLRIDRSLRPKMRVMFLVN
ncbi:hypothetical protein N0V88_001251 [Collariella sp. IMI 366227]|nr:hypothetical protein N0V88_001251 [Collariella sp. IMI 366227]